MKSIRCHRSLCVILALATASVLPSFPLFAQAPAAPAAAPPATPQSLARQMEKLDRGLIVLHHEPTKAWISWRILGTDPDTLAFNVYRSANGAAPVKLNADPITGPSFYIDEKTDFTVANAYTVRPILNGTEQPPSKPFLLPANAPVRPYLSIPIKILPRYTANDASVADLDGDGEYEIILKSEGRAHDNSQAGITDPTHLQAYKLDGTLLWDINLGRNIRGGAHYTQFLCYDFDGDGKAEVACKTADGGTDGIGKPIGDPKANWVDNRGMILSGPEYCTIFEGTTGKALDTIPYEPARGIDNPAPTTQDLRDLWGDGNGNRNDRFLGAVAYLDGVHPSLIFSRGYYTRTFVWAVDFKDGKLAKRWLFDSGPGGRGNKWAGQGNHNLSVADVDHDGKDDIIFGAMVVGSDGKGLSSTGLGHGDSIHVSAFDPAQPNRTLVARIQERVDDAGLHVYDPATGEVLWRKPTTDSSVKNQGPGRGVAFDIDPTHPGAEVWCGVGGGITGMFDIHGNQILDLKDIPEEKRPSINMGIWWDGDDLRELLDGTVITKWDWVKKEVKPIFKGTDFECVSNNGTKQNPCLSGDILGDWREELILRNQDSTELRIFSTTIPTSRRLYTLMHDPQYRLSIAWQNVAYNQPPHTSFFFGADMKEPPKPNITLVEPKASVTTAR